MTQAVAMEYSTGHGRVRFGALLGVMDEVELLPGCLAHLARIGVDSVLALDGGSTDGSLELLRSLEGEGLSVLEPMKDHPHFDVAQWAQWEGEIVRSMPADWVLCLDVDEFWLPASGSLHDGDQWRDPSIDVLGVPRFNVALTSGGPLTPDDWAPTHYGDVWMFTRPIPNFRQRLESQRTLAWITGVPIPKVALRPDRVGRMDTGWHGAVGPDSRVLARQVADGLIAAHLPFTTVGRFRHKVDNIRRLLDAPESGFGPNHAWHWRRWASLDTPQAVEAEFDRQCLTLGEVDALRANGSLRSAADLMEERVS